MALVLRNCTRFSLLSRSGALRPSCILMRSLQSSTAEGNEPKEDFFAKNERMKRPMAPHLTIYKFEFPAMLSGSHRATGFAMTGVTVGLGICALVLPDNFETYVNMIKGWDLPRPIIFGAKTLLAWPVCYHGLNGLRHLCWDVGKGFEIKTMYKTGTVVGITATALAMAIVCYL